MEMEEELKDETITNNNSCNILYDFYNMVNGKWNL